METEKISNELNEVIEDAKNNLKDLTPGSSEMSKGVSDLDTLYRAKIEAMKAEAEIEDKIHKQKSAKKERIEKIVTDGVSILAPLAVTAVISMVGFAFESDHYPRSKPLIKMYDKALNYFKK